MSAATEITKYGAGTGYIYVTRPDNKIVANIPNTPIGKEQTDRFVIASAPISGSRVASSVVELTSGSGTITNLTVGGVSIFDTSSAVTGGSLSILATNLATAINSFISSPNFIATADGEKVYVFTALTGSASNGDAVVLTTSGTLAGSTTTMDGGTSNTDNFDQLTGYKVYINSDPSAVAGDLSGASDVTKYVVRKPANSAQSVDAYTIASGNITVTRNSLITEITVDTEGGAAKDNLDYIVSDGFNEADILIIRGLASGKVTTVTESGNINLANNATFDTGTKDNVIALQYFGGDWYELFRSPGVALTVANLRSAGIPEPVSGTNTTALTAGGGTINLTPGTDEGYQIITGSVTLSSSWTIQGAGSPIDGDTFIVDYRGTITASGNNVTIFGIALTDTQILEGNVMVRATYDSTLSGYRAVLFYSADGEDLVNTTDLATKEDSLGNPSADGQILASTTGGTRSWVDPSADIVQGSNVNALNASSTGTDDTLTTYTIPAGTWAANGDSLDFYYMGETAANANAKTIKIEIDGNVVANNAGFLASPNGRDFNISVKAMRASSTTLKVMSVFDFGGGDSAVTYTEISALDLDNNPYGVAFVVNVSATPDVTFRAANATKQIA